MSSVIEIPLTQGQVALIDAASAGLVFGEGLHWFAISSNLCFYAARNQYGPGGHREKLIYMHRLILRLEPGEFVDHINRIGTDNRLANLRRCTRSENQANRRRSRSNSSGFKGVYFDRSKGKWRAGIQIAGKPIFIGLFEDKILAARAYDRAAKEEFGEFAVVNFQ